MSLAAYLTIINIGATILCLGSAFICNGEVNLLHRILMKYKNEGGRMHD
jgi:hypothetical protein